MVDFRKIVDSRKRKSIRGKIVDLRKKVDSRLIGASRKIVNPKDSKPAEDHKSIVIREKKKIVNSRKIKDSRKIVDPQKIKDSRKKLWIRERQWIGER